ncbi:MAG: carbohydrate-binding domain-containing protein, partial [Eubacterium sp.]|nr:carbohydrate-binding domain-containing protein [Eubacterium sp.]
MFKKLTALIISLAMVIGAIQFNAVSVFTEAQITTTGGLSVFTQDSGGIEYDSAAGLVTISGAGEFLVWGSTDQETIKVADSTDKIQILLSSVSIESSTAAPIEVDCGNEVAIHFEGSCSLISNSDDQGYPGVNYAGIQKTSVDNTLTIRGQWGETETLTVQSGYKSAGIGGAQGSPGKNITIDSGTVTAYGGILAAGIGGGCDYYGTTKSTVIINGGIVTAYGGTAAAGIGSGRGDSVGNNVTTINGGTVYAYGGGDDGYGYYGGSGIGVMSGVGGDVTIIGGTVYAYCGDVA